LSASAQFGGSQSGTASGQTDGADMQRLGVAAAEDLRQVVRTALTDLFGNFLRRLPAALTAASRSAPTAAEQSSCLKLARSVSAEPDRWRETYIQQVDNQLAGGPAPAPNKEERASAVPMDEVISLANVELRAEALHQKLVADLDSRFDRIRRTLHVPIYTKALAPAGLCRALSDTADLLEVPVKQRRVLFEKFDEIVVAELQTLYRSLLDALERISVSATRVSKGPAAYASPLPQAVDLESTLPRASPKVEKARLLNVDSKTVSMLEAHAARADTGGYSDGSLAADLLTLTSNEPLPGLKNDLNWVPLQRMKLAGDYLNESVSDPFVPPELSPQHESVRFPLVKSALTDSTLFTAVTHPLRSLVNELMLKSATSRITGSVEARRMAELLQQVLVQFDLAPEFVREAMLTAQPIPEEHIQKFFESQKQQAQERRETVINQAKRVVIQELEHHTFGRGVPAPALKFLNSAWGPLLVKHLLIHGANNPTRKEDLDLMEHLLDLLDERAPSEPPTPDWQELMQKMGSKLAENGLSADRVTEALLGLEAARQAPPVT